MTAGRVVVGDCVGAMADMKSASIDAIVTDPPYELGFMGKRWDASGIAYSVPMWREAHRVLKPGGHLLAFGGTRTYHRMACAIEDSGFEVRDSLHWMYGSGFPKSLDVEKAAGVRDGWGTALKPGHEPIVVARRPLVGTVADNVLAYGTGALNVDGCRVGEHEMSAEEWRAKGLARTTGNTYGEHHGSDTPLPPGRWPPNVIFSHDPECVEGGACVEGCPVAELDRQSGPLKSGAMAAGTVRSARSARSVCYGAMPDTATLRDISASQGGASRFFPVFRYVAKPSRRERDLGCESLPARGGGEATERDEGSEGLNSPRAGAGRNGGARNIHPTVKPIAMMRWLCRLVTPPGGVVLDPFTGSGTTGIAALQEGFRFIGIERDPEYARIAELRIIGGTHT